MRRFDRVSFGTTAFLVYNAGMVVYVEYVIIDNTVLTYCIALIAYRLAGMRPSRLRALFAALIGTGVALGYPFLSAVWAIWLIKLGLAALLSLVLFAGKRRSGGQVRQVLRDGAYFMLSTAVFGGALFFVGYLYTGSARQALLSPVDFPVGLVVAAGWLVFAAAKRLTVRVRRRRQTQTVALCVEWRGRTADCEGILDTGNGVFDPQSGLPVAVLTARTTVRLLGDEQLTAFLLGRGDGRWLDASGAGGKQKILLIEDATISLYTGEDKNILYDVTPGLSLMRSPYGAILHPSAFKGTDISL